jgi:GTPase SAR1 family protein
MRIVMVGHEGVGKTTYVACMYREMATSGLHGFWVRANSDGEHRRLLSAATRVAQSSYPPPSEQRSTYGLTLRHGSTALIDFTWGDYRGGVMRESQTAQSEEFLEDAMSADAVLIFIESTDLAGSRARGRARIRDLTNLAFQIIDRREVLVPIVLVITKSDLIENGEIPVEPLTNFLTAVNGDQRVRATIAPVVCGPQTSNLLLPVMFSLYFGLLVRAAELQARADAAEQTAIVAEAGRSLGDWVRSRLAGVATNGELAQLARRQAWIEYKNLEPLLGPVRALGTMLAEVPVW